MMDSEEIIKKIQEYEDAFDFCINRGHMPESISDDDLLGDFVEQAIHDNPQIVSQDPLWLEILKEEILKFIEAMLDLFDPIEVQFRKFQPVDAPDLYPVKYRKEIDEFNDWLFPNINDGHYRQAFATSPKAYKDGYNAFHNALEKLGDYITDSDIRIYVSLVKWETDFYLLDVGPQKKRIREYKNIWGYLRDLFSLKEFKRYANLPSTEYNKEHRKYAFGNYLTRIASQIDYEKEWAIGDERKKLSSDPENVYLRHPENETVEDYITEISQSQWNIDTVEARSNKTFNISVDPSINPLKGLLKNN